MKWYLLIIAFARIALAQTPVRVDRFETELHTIASPSFIRVPKPGPFDSVRFEVRVDTLGQVIDAKPLSGRQEYMEAAAQVVRTRRFKPFLRDGQPVDAIVEAWIVVLPPELVPKVHVPFPDIQDWGTVRVKLIRTGCFGSCPSYEVEIRGDGTVTYTGKRDVAVPGVHKSSIERSSLEALIKLFREADYFSFDTKYAGNFSDYPTYTTSLTIDGKAHAVEDYDGARAGMPLVIGDLESAVDEYAGTEKWVRGTPETIPALRAEGFDFKSQDAGRFLAHVARRGNADDMRALIMAGAPLDVPNPVGWLLEMPLQAAVNNPDPEVIRLLIEAGASKDDAATKKIVADRAQFLGRQDILSALEKYEASR